MPLPPIAAVRPRLSRALFAVVAWVGALTLPGGAARADLEIDVAQAPEEPQVLVLNSYHLGYNWSDGEQAAVLRTLARGRPDILPSVEYLDWRRFPSLAREKLLLEQLEAKYDGRRFSLIVALDDPAVTFVLNHRDYFGASVPVVFGGVNDVEMDFFRQHRAVTGVAQTYDFAGTLAMIHRLQPGVKRIAAVHCRTESGLASRRAFEKVVARVKPPFEFDWVEGWTAETLLQRVATLPDDTAVLILSIFRDEAGKVLVDDPDFGRSLAARSRVPVYFVAPPLARLSGGDTWETAVWQGMGGSLLSEDLHGELVARLALRVLAGEPADSIPIVAESPARMAFDYRQLERFGIAPSALPPEAEVFHAPPTFYQVHRSRIVAGIVVIVVLALLVVLLTWIVLLRRRAEQALRRSHEHFQLIARATNDAVWDWDLGNGTLWWNDGYLEQLRLPAGAPMGFAAWESHVHPEDLGWVLKLLRETLHSGLEHSQAEYRVVRTDGETRHVLDRIFVARAGTGKPSRLLGARLDVTERIRAEQERLRLVAAVEQSAEAILLFDPDGLVRYANPAFERTTGVFAPKTMREVCSLFHDGGGADSLELARAQAEATRAGRWSARLECTRRDGAICLMQLAVFPIRDRGGAILSLVLVGQDVTREAKLEDQVRLSQKMEAVGLLAGGIAHDFNNLLQVINGFTVQAQEAETAEDRSECLQQVREASARAAQLTRQLLVFSRDDKIATMADLDLNEVIEAQLKMLRRLLEAPIEVVFNPAREPGNVRGDRGQFEQVFMNLCLNARDAMPRGGRITLSVEPERFDEPYCAAHPWARRGDYVQVAVADTGTGMDRATLARIFDPFFTTKPKGKGTGLGLAIVYGIVKKHEGLIHVYSEVGVGTTFRLYFPVRARERATVAADAASVPIQGSGTILLVEDDPSVSRLATRVLERAGYRVMTADDGEKAWRIFQTESALIDLIVLDAILPKLNGREVYEKIRALDPRKPVLFCSGYSAGTIQPEFFPGDDVQLLAKPYDPKDLLRRVAELLGK